MTRMVGGERAATPASEQQGDFLVPGVDAPLVEERQRISSPEDVIRIASLPDWKEVLLTIVRREGMDPWDVDVSLVAARYLEEVRKMRLLNLRMSANVILATSVLLRLKADSWALRPAEIPEYMWIPDSVIIEPAFPELTPVLRTTPRKITLDELIHAVGDIIKITARREARRERLHVEVPPALLNILITNKEDFERLQNSVYSRIRQLADKGGLVLFSNLIGEKTREEVIRNFIPVLHLSTQKHIMMWQEQVFGEIFISLNGHAQHSNP
ncbi:segregation/condensation protein A [Candidatus Micrarchaeota archaeon]|nr:segregation/condensation protein A [Candidatus Micrarchaeota archaeon]